MASEFEMEMQSGIRQLTDSALGQSVTIIQAGVEFAVNAIWREGEAVERVYPGVHATVFVALEDFAGGDRVGPKVGDRVQLGSNLYEVREKLLNGVGGATLLLRFVQEL